MNEQSANDISDLENLDLNAITRRKVMLGFEFAFIFFLFNVVFNVWYEGDYIYAGYLMIGKFFSNIADGVMVFKSAILAFSVIVTILVLVGVLVFWILKLLKVLKDDKQDTDEYDFYIARIISAYIPFGLIIPVLTLPQVIGQEGITYQWTYRLFAFLAFLIALFYVPGMTKHEDKGGVYDKIKDEQKKDIIFGAYGTEKSFYFQKIHPVLFLLPVLFTALTVHFDLDGTSTTPVIVVSAILILLYAGFFVYNFLSKDYKIYRDTDFLPVSGALSAFVLLIFVNQIGGEYVFSLPGGGTEVLDHYFSNLQVLCYAVLIILMGVSISYIKDLKMRLYGGWGLIIITALYILIKF